MNDLEQEIAKKLLRLNQMADAIIRATFVMDDATGKRFLDEIRAMRALPSGNRLQFFQHLREAIGLMQGMIRDRPPSAEATALIPDLAEGQATVDELIALETGGRGDE